MRTCRTLSLAAVLGLATGAGLRQPGELSDPPTGAPNGLLPIARIGSDAPLRFVGLSAGDYTMGGGLSCTEPGGTASLRVQVAAFAIGESEVSQAQWADVVRAAQAAGDPDARSLNPDPSVHKGPRYPVDSVSWCDAARFANALSRLEGRQPVYQVGPGCEDKGEASRDPAADGFRLPTSIEWEYAARAGTRGPFSFGDDPELSCTYGNVLDRPAAPENLAWEGPDCVDNHLQVAPVCTFLKNPWGLCDVHGNVWEWLADADPRRRSPPPQVWKEIGGGSWFNVAIEARSFERGSLPPSLGHELVGFRLAMSPTSDPRRAGAANR